MNCKNTQGEEKENMKTYEYQCVAIWGMGEKTTRRLNEYGLEGWELVSTQWIWHYFKRPL